MNPDPRTMDLWMMENEDLVRFYKEEVKVNHYDPHGEPARDGVHRSVYTEHELEGELMSRIRA